MRKIRDFFTARSAALTCTAGTGAATAHFCSHPCIEHAILAVILWGVGIFAAFRDANPAAE